MITDIETLPAQLRAAIEALPPGALDQPYRPGGWTRRQVVHHLADSHMNAYMRFKLALTEDNPVIKPYDQNAWAATADAGAGSDIEASLKLLEGLHERWVRLLRSMTEADFQRTFTHPEHGRTFTLAYTLEQYANHGKKHLGHIAGNG